MQLLSRFSMTLSVITALFFCIPSTIGSMQISVAPRPNDVARNLVDHFKFDNLWQIRSAKLEQAHVPEQPWSGWYWPLNDGGLAYRYADGAFPTGAAWPVISKYLLDSLGKGPVANFSPSEKYDLLLGDKNFTLTRMMIQSAEDHQSNGSIEAWMGYCTGWANAAMMMPRPLHSVHVMAADGKTQIEFRPTDIKALGALLWATGTYPARVLGNVCQETPVQRDPRTGRPLNPDCQDTNPATFHLSVVNQIGVGQRSFLIDSDSGYQVWNQPLSSYSYSYFNPSTMKPAPLDQASINIKDFANDKFKGLRAPGTAFVVGVEMKVVFIYETRPTLESTDSPNRDERRYPTYRYDLELDETGRIIGGEWHTRLHPDVLWVSDTNTNPTTHGDSLVRVEEQWQSDRPLPASWIAGAKASEQVTQPLGVIVQKLFEWARR